MNLLEEGRASIVNGLVAYGQHFKLLNEEDIDEKLLSDIAEMLEGIEAMIPVMASLYEMTKKLNGNPDLTFMDWLEELLREHGSKMF